MQEDLGDRRITLGRYYSYWFDRTPRRALYHLSYYKFASKMIGPGRRVLDIGCSEGIGTWLLAKECGFARGVDLDSEAIEIAKGNWNEPAIEFACEDFLLADQGNFDALTSFDVIEHILPDHADSFLARAAGCLNHDGIAVIGTPSLEGQRYASEVSRAGHVNVYDGERLRSRACAAGRSAPFVLGGNHDVDRHHIRTRSRAPRRLGLRRLPAPVQAGPEAGRGRRGSHPRARGGRFDRASLSRLELGRASSSPGR